MDSRLLPLPFNSQLDFNVRSITVAVTTYFILCQTLRYARKWYLWVQYPYKDRTSFGKMTATHAYEIQRVLFRCEFPLTMGLSLGFALFRTYGIPSISKLLVQTRQLSDKKYAPKVRTCIAPANGAESILYQCLLPCRGLWIPACSSQSSSRMRQRTQGRLKPFRG